MSPPLIEPAVAPVPHPRLTTTEVCQLARLSRASVWRRIAAGRLPAPIDHGRQALFCAQAVAAALQKTPERPSPEEAAYGAQFERLMAKRASKPLTLKKLQNKTAPNSEVNSESRSAIAGLGPDRRTI